jgi:hypothetical protein
LCFRILVSALLSTGEIGSRAKVGCAPLVEAEVDGQRLAQPDLLGFCILLLIAGKETCAAK